VRLRSPIGVSPGYFRRISNRTRRQQHANPCAAKTDAAGGRAYDSQGLCARHPSKSARCNGSGFNWNMFHLRNTNESQVTDNKRSWRERVEVESTTRSAKDRVAGFEGREGHRTPFAPVARIPSQQRSYWTQKTAWVSVLGSGATVVLVAIRETASCRLAMERCA
jgi:hypothetical protein